MIPNVHRIEPYAVVVFTEFNDKKVLFVDKIPMIVKTFDYIDEPFDVFCNCVDPNPLPGL